MRYPLLGFPLSDDPSRYSCRTTVNCRPNRPSRVGCRFGRIGSSGLVGRLFRLRLSNREPVPRARSCRDRCRYRYICRPKRIQFSLRGRLKNRNCVRAYREDFTSGLELSYGLRLALKSIFERKKFII